MNHRRAFIKKTALLSTGVLGGALLPSCSTSKSSASEEVAFSMMPGGEMFFKISLAQWSFHKAFFSKKMDHLDFAAKTKSLGMDGIEYVNQFFKDKAEDSAYLAMMNQRAANAGVKQLLIMVDGEGGLGDTDDAKRKVAITNHYKWVDAAKALGCHSIRVNAYGQGTMEDVGSAAVDGLGGVSEYAAKEDINVIVENHGSYSSNGAWLAGVMKQVGMANCGTLPDFGNFCIKRDTGNLYSGGCIEEYDRYKGVTEMMPYAKAVSAKAHDFDEMGNETHTDYMKMMQIVKDHGYKGYVGIEYEGNSLDAEAGIIKTRDLLIKVGKALS